MILIILTLPPTVTRMALRGMTCTVVRTNKETQTDKQEEELELVDQCRVWLSVFSGVVGVSVLAIIIVTMFLICVKLFY